MNFNKFPSQAPKEEKQVREPMGSLIEKLSEGPVHGSGLSAYTPEQRVELEALLSSAGSSLDDLIVKTLTGETLIDIQSFLNSANGSSEQLKARDAIKTAIKVATEKYYKE
jgi:hypothetical protein